MTKTTSQIKTDSMRGDVNMLSTPSAQKLWDLKRTLSILYDFVK